MDQENRNMEEENNLIELVDEDGNTLNLEHILTYEHNDNYYVAFVPVEESETDAEEEEIVLMRLEAVSYTHLFPANG